MGFMSRQEIFTVIHKQSKTSLSNHDTLDEAFTYRLSLYRKQIYGRKELSVIGRPANFGEGLYE